MKRFTKTLAAIMLMTAVIFAAGCTPEENHDNDVRVTTYAPRDVTATSVVCGGDVIVTQDLTLMNSACAGARVAIPRWRTLTFPPKTGMNRMFARLQVLILAPSTMSALTPCVAWSVIMVRTGVSSPRVMVGEEAI